MHQCMWTLAPKIHVQKHLENISRSGQERYFYKINARNQNKVLTTVIL